MFGFSLPKLVFTVLLIAVVIYGFKAITRFQEQRERQVQGGAKRRRAAGGEIEDMVACDVCGTFVSSRGARACGRGDCPYPA